MGVAEVHDAIAEVHPAIAEAKAAIAEGDAAIVELQGVIVKSDAVIGEPQGLIVRPQGVIAGFNGAIVASLAGIDKVQLVISRLCTTPAMTCARGNPWHFALPIWRPFAFFSLLPIHDHERRF